MTSFLICPLFLLVLLSIPITAVIMTGAWRMRQMESYSLCVAAAVLAVIPIHAGFLLGIPFGIWALNLLSKPEVKAAFRAKELQMQKK